MAIDNTPPRLKLIATIAVIVVITLVGLDFVFKSYYAIHDRRGAAREARADDATRTSSARPRRQRSPARKLPIDQAMAQLAKGTRPELIAPKPSEDLGPMTGWSKLPKQAPLPPPAPACRWRHDGPRPMTATPARRRAADGGHDGRRRRRACSGAATPACPIRAGPAPPRRRRQSTDVELHEHARPHARSNHEGAARRSRSVCRCSWSSCCSSSHAGRSRADRRHAARARARRRDRAPRRPAPARHRLPRSHRQAGHAPRLLRRQASGRAHVRVPLVPRALQHGARTRPSHGLRGIGWTVGKEFDVVTISIDPNESLEKTAAQARVDPRASTARRAVTTARAGTSSSATRRRSPRVAAGRRLRVPVRRATRSSGATRRS